MMVTKNVHISDIIIRVCLWVAFCWLERCDPYVRVIQPEELYLYKYPNKASYVSPGALWVYCFLVPVVLVTVRYFRNGDRRELAACVLCITFTVGLTGALTSLLKIVVGRPRPDFYRRCFPDGGADDGYFAQDKGADLLAKCHGERREVMDGLKSFPSGHASLSFAAMTLVALYLGDRCRMWTCRCTRGETWQLCAMVVPLVFATLVAASRTCDYHHHYQDVIGGALLGSAIASVSYKLHFKTEEDHTTSDI